MAAKKAKQPKPPAPAAMGKKAAAMGSKVTSAATRDKMAKQPSAVQGKRMTAQADAYKKTGAGYMKQTYNSAAGDLSGRGRMLNAKDEFFAYPVYADNGRISQRAKYQAKRKNK